MKSVITVLFCTSLLVTAAGARADDTTLRPYTYRVVVPALDRVTCDAHAQEIASVFAGSTSLKVTGSMCEGNQTVIDAGQNYATDIVVVNYLAQYEVAPYRAVFGGRVNMGLAEDTSGVFTTYDECLKELGLQSASYQAETGLAYVAGHCDASTDSFNPGFSLTLEGFGTPTSRLYAYADPVSIFDNSRSPQVHQAALAAIQASGGHVTFDDTTAHVFYYANYELPVTVTELGDFDTSDECTAQLAEAQNIFSQAKETAVAAFCLPGSATDTVTGHLTAVFGGADSISDDFGAGSPKYATFTECMTDRDRVVQDKISEGESVLGAICKQADDLSAGFVVEVYSTYY